MLSFYNSDEAKLACSHCCVHQRNLHVSIAVCISETYVRKPLEPVDIPTVVADDKDRVFVTLQPLPTEDIRYIVVKFIDMKLTDQPRETFQRLTGAGAVCPFMQQHEPECTLGMTVPLSSR